MLKIKDNIDLKELEKKYDITFIYNRYNGKIDEIYFIDKKYEEGHSARLMLIAKKKTIKRGILFKRDAYVFKLEYVCKANFYNSIDLLYDLIKADLVEKVED